MNRTLLAAALLLFACSKSPEPAAADQTKSAEKSAALPTKEQAAKIITEAPEFADFQFTYASWSVPLDKNALNDNTRKTVEELRAAGWLGYDGDGNVVLAKKAEEDRRFLVRSNRTLDIVPLAKKELMSIDSIARRADGNVQVGFTWRWIPNEVGSALRSGLIAEQLAATHRANARLLSTDGAWTLLIIEPVEGTAAQ